jgi:hypothetical protein
MKSILLLIAAAGAFALGWLAHSRLAPALPPVYEVVAVRRDTIRGDSVPYPVPVPAPVARYVASAPDTVLIAADTAAILADYLSTRYYCDTVLNDAEALIAVSEEVRRNRIAERSVTFQNRRATAITTTTVAPPPRVQLYAGAIAGRGLAAPVVQVSCGRWSFGAGYNLSGGGVVGSVGYRVR